MLKSGGSSWKQRVTVAKLPKSSWFSASRERALNNSRLIQISDLALGWYEYVHPGNKNIVEAKRFALVVWSTKYIPRAVLSQVLQPDREGNILDVGTHYHGASSRGRGSWGPGVLRFVVVLPALILAPASSTKVSGAVLATQEVEPSSSP